MHKAIRYLVSDLLGLYLEKGLGVQRCYTRGFNLFRPTLLLESSEGHGHPDTHPHPIVLKGSWLYGSLDPAFHRPQEETQRK